jgi:hypothetical protein
VHRDDGHEYDNHHICDLNQSIIKFIRSLLEGANGTDIPRLIANSVNFSVLWHRLGYVYETYCREQHGGVKHLEDATLSTEDYDTETRGKSVSLMEGFGIWILMNQLADMNPDLYDYIHTKSKHGENYRNVVSFFTAATCRVEVVDGRGKLQRLYFAKPIVAGYLTSGTRDKVGGIHERCVDFLRWLWFD